MHKSIASELSYAFGPTAQRHMKKTKITGRLEYYTL